MRVLMLESHPGVANEAIAELTDAGHTIVRCDTADRRYPCRGLVPGADCPLDEHVDVALVVQEIGTHQVEHGAVCAARSRVPVVAVGPADFVGGCTVTPRETPTPKRWAIASSRSAWLARASCGVPTVRSRSQWSEAPTVC